ncbi:MAG: hypothetical protein FWH40_09990 [Coriobacteriia bacterium]|nr:hypothetical protein [Coriobacteriia bacterium]
MTIADEDTIDFAGIEKDTGTLVLTIVDHLAWGEEYDGVHLLFLQNKMNTYLQFIEGGQVNDSFPPEAYEKIVIRVIAQYPFSSDCLRLLDLSKQAIVNAGFDLEWELSQT